MDKRFRRYFASLSEVGGFANWVIAKVRLKIENNSCEMDEYEKHSTLSADIKKQRKNYAVLITWDDKITLEVHLIRITSKNKDSFNSISIHDSGIIEKEFDEYLCRGNMFFYDSVVFEKSDILDFVQEVGDENPIHSTKNAVVPGFLMLEHLLEKENIMSCDIKYIQPVFEGEKIEIYKGEKNFEAWVWHYIDGSYVKAVKVFELYLL